MTTNPKYFELSLAHISLAAVQYGDSDKPVILALHGWLDNLNSFIPLAEQFQLHGMFDTHQLICIDWPGHGFSDHRPGQYPLHWVDYIYDLHSVVNHYKSQDFTVSIVGHSLGGIVAAAYNAAFADQINKLILIEAISPLFEEEQKVARRLQRGVSTHFEFTTKQTKQLSPRYFDKHSAILARHKLTQLDVNWCELITERNITVSDDGSCWRSDPRLRLDSVNRLSFAQVEQLMNSTGTPSLLIVGNRGYKQLKSLLPKAVRWFTDIETVTLEGDHHLHMGCAESVAIHIRAFILKPD
ncbi:alpha/beta fold hydrolase [Shewanella maritima]|uniref:alpha/beta fold hydrolase n=1 Tax=Shewanella maritima TaxID=2520507 RepID=UPI003735A029